MIKTGFAIGGFRGFDDHMGFTIDLSCSYCYHGFHAPIVFVVWIVSMVLMVLEVLVVLMVLEGFFTIESS